MTMPDFFTALYAVLVAIEDGKVTHGEVTYSDEDPDGRSVSLSMTVARQPLEVDATTPDD